MALTTTRSQRLQTRFTPCALTPRHASGSKTLGSDPNGGGTDSPLTPKYLVIERLFSGPRIRSAAAVIVSARGDERFFRGVEPERRRSYTADAIALR